MPASIKISPSILSADMGNLARDLQSIAEADFIHIDVMDGHFTPNLTFGPQIVRVAKAVSDVPLDVHMMVSNPEESIDWYADAGADLITVHYEAATHLHRIVSHLHDRGIKAGVVLNPATPVCVLDSIIEDLDMVLLMSVNPGFGGQTFIEGTYAKLKALTALCHEHQVAPLIEVDGGVCMDNVEKVVRAGANVLVAGSAVLGKPNPATALQELKDKANLALLSNEA